MVATEMLKNGFVPGKGLGASLQGIMQPMSLRENLGTFGLVFKPTGDDVKKARKLKKKAMTTVFHDMIHKEIEVYVDEVIVKSKQQADHVGDLRKFIQRFRRYNLKLNPAKCAFGVPSGKLFIAQLTTTCETIFKLLKKDAAVKYCDESPSIGLSFGENPVDEEYEPLRTYFLDEEVMHIDEVEQVEKPGWKLFFDGAADMKGVGIGVVFISEIGHHYPITAQLCFYYTNNMAEYKAWILGLRLAVDMGVQEVLVLGYLDLLFRSIEFRHILRIHNEVADALATSASMLHHPDKVYVDPLHIQVHDQHAYCNMVEEELDSEPRFHDIREYIGIGVYPVQATSDQKRTIRHLASEFFLSGGILYKRTPNLGLLRCIDAKQAMTIMIEVHPGVCGPHMNGYVMAKKILRAGYYWLTMERDYISFVRKCHQF
ncbi:uncharacterized protein [Nicotiana sylvestris]|uniref:uncharacterized protein n=1 Tax=Nicotiana sylvestris TaxID=4096 RepID=UPI00388C9EB9